MYDYRKKTKKKKCQLHSPLSFHAQMNTLTFLPEVENSLKIYIYSTLDESLHNGQPQKHFGRCTKQVRIRDAQNIHFIFGGRQTYTKVP